MTQKPKISTNQRISWEEYAMRIAEVVAQRSEDPYIKVGACILRHDNSILSVGYNGAAPNCDIDWTDRDNRRKFVSHAERSALRYAQPNEGKLIAITLLPCESCIVDIAMYGIKKVYYRDVYDKSEANTRIIAKTYGVQLIQLERIKEEAPKFHLNEEIYFVIPDQKPPQIRIGKVIQVGNSKEDYTVECRMNDPQKKGWVKLYDVPEQDIVRTAEEAVMLAEKLKGKFIFSMGEAVFFVADQSIRQGVITEVKEDDNFCEITENKLNRIPQKWILPFKNIFRDIGSASIAINASKDQKSSFAYKQEASIQEAVGKPKFAIGERVCFVLPAYQHLKDTTFCGTIEKVDEKTKNYEIMHLSNENDEESGIFSVHEDNVFRTIEEAFDRLKILYKKNN